MKHITLIITIMLAASCTVKPSGSWSGDETALVLGADSLMRVLTIDHIEDSLFLRQPSKPLSDEDLKTEVYTKLERLMLATVVDEGGVGIAGPQVGIGRRVVAVQRFDKDGEPFELYPNIRITALRGEPEPGSEGCLSVPGKRGSVLRYRDIDIAYTSTATLRDTSETVQGFTAVIFQHETDHLDGIIYCDRAESVRIEE